MKNGEKITADFPDGITSAAQDDDKQIWTEKMISFHKVSEQKSRNNGDILIRLRDYEDDVLRFMTRENAPFTNNLAENDLRMIKVQQKIS